MKRNHSQVRNSRSQIGHCRFPIWKFEFLYVDTVVSIAGDRSFYIWKRNRICRELLIADVI
ncbi:MAG: hypothetical protein K2P55_02440 [Bacteroides acidifaciens]|uniref:hypothetical protein n=1 Tax=Bacteroides acidifaciens TaxID=85831 RepID=UPI0023C7D5F5|nr:hypothetical protein [Bacteroides acidifaciens]MDE6820224.1 hypothetical protein [Bacteroides acidifaciens]MDE6985808.1 hypothetical protein [Bacteroides acidifaciens]